LRQLPDNPQMDLAGTFAEAKARAVDRFERAYLDALVRRCGGNLSCAGGFTDLRRAPPPECDQRGHRRPEERAAHILA
jgi:hypothetical protein